MLEIADNAARRGEKATLLVLRRNLRALEAEIPDVAHKIKKIITSYSGLGVMRSLEDLDRPPVDRDTGMELLQIDHHPELTVNPVINRGPQIALEEFLRERFHTVELRTAGIRPPTSLALLGPPGTGKTTVAKWIAIRLGLPLMTLNLASVVTSYLGQTGQNLKRAFDQARNASSVLLLDEFDALGRTRLDNGDIGEMRRVVTVLLQELERWPDHSVIIAATNLPELMDEAFRRRFSRWVLLDFPEEEERIKILQGHYRGKHLSIEYLALAAIALEGLTGADLAAFSNRVSIRQLLDKTSPIDSLHKELLLALQPRELSDTIKVRFAEFARSINKQRFSYRTLATLLNVSHTSVVKYLKRQKLGA
ncbi:MAG: AAA family ATPase [Desulfomonilaceae bacterium]